MKLTREDLLEICNQAHDELHKGNTQEAHELLHKALDGERLYMLRVNPLLHRAAFDVAFRDASAEHGAVAMYILADNQTSEGQVRILTGGDAQLCIWVESIFKKAAVNP